jgi:hypothetical protein
MRLKFGATLQQRPHLQVTTFGPSSVCSTLATTLESADIIATLGVDGMGLLARFKRAFGTLGACWKASNVPRGRSIDPTLYSSDHLSRWLPFRFSTGLTPNPKATMQVNFR